MSGKIFPHICSAGRRCGRNCALTSPEGGSTEWRSRQDRARQTTPYFRAPFGYLWTRETNRRRDLRHWSQRQSRRQKHHPESRYWLTGENLRWLIYKDGVTIRDSISMPVRFIRSPFIQGCPFRSPLSPFCWAHVQTSYLIQVSGFLSTRQHALLCWISIELY